MAATLLFMLPDDDPVLLRAARVRRGRHRHGRQGLAWSTSRSAWSAGARPTRPSSSTACSGGAPRSPSASSCCSTRTPCGSRSSGASRRAWPRRPDPTSPCAGRATRPMPSATRTSCVCQLRVGGQAARHRDELLGREFGLIGQETTGVGGFAKALRTIPVMLEIARLVAREAPRAVLRQLHEPGRADHGAPASPHARCGRSGSATCPWNMRVDLAAELGVPVERVELDYVGLNHLSWVRTLRVDGEDRTSEMLARARVDAGHARTAGSREPGFSPATLALIGMLPSYYCRYFYETARDAPVPGAAPDPRLRGDGDRAPAAAALRGSGAAREAARADGAGRRLLLRVGRRADGGHVERRRQRAGRERPQRRRAARAARRRRDRGACADRPERRRRPADSPVARRRRCAGAHGQGLRAADDRGRAARRPAAGAARADHEPARARSGVVPHVWERLRRDNQGMLGALDG